MEYPESKYAALIRRASDEEFPEKHRAWVMNAKVAKGEFHGEIPDTEDPVFMKLKFKDDTTPKPRTVEKYIIHAHKLADEGYLNKTGKGVTLLRFFPQGGNVFVGQPKGAKIQIGEITGDNKAGPEQENINMIKPPVELIQDFIAYYKTDAQSTVEDHYKDIVTEANLRAMDDAAFIDFFFHFARDGGKIQSQGERSASKFKKTIENNLPAFRSFAMEPWRRDFDPEGWLERIAGFKYFGSGLATIWLNRIDKKLFSVVNGKAEKAVELFRIDIPSKLEQKYRAINLAQKQLLDWHPELNNFFQADTLNHFLIGTEEGIKWRFYLLTHPMLASFRQKYPEFKTFENSGPAYKGDEDDYKRGLSTWLHRELDGWVKDEEDFSPSEVLKRIQMVMTKRIPGLKQVSNLTNHYDHAAIFSTHLSAPERREKFVSLLQPLLRVASTESDIDVQLGALLNWFEEIEFPQNLTKAFPSLLLFLWNPERFVFIKPSLFDNLLKSQNEKTTGSGVRMDVPMFNRVHMHVRHIKEAISELEPRDMIDVQSFIWCSQQSGPLPPPPMNHPINQILYGPPGTGKTYALKNEYFAQYTSSQTEQTPEQLADEIAGATSWWEVIALVLLDLESGKVADVLAHPLMQARIRNANVSNPRASIWGQLQSHTKEDCEFVKYKNRQEPLIFEKSSKSIWSIDRAQAEEQVPELVERLDRWRRGPAAGIDEIRYVFTTFHQSYTYEDFIEGIKPVLTEDGLESQLGYELKPGVFKEIARKALENPTKKYALFIDEINRGNVASIFGELITLIEPDKRKGAAQELSVQLPYSRETFSVPANLDIIGTMNTADRSVEALDSALRRRFEFVEMVPDITKIEPSEVEGIDLRTLLDTINARIERLLDKDHCIGHSYLIGLNSFDDLRSAFANKILPLLAEYFYHDPSRIGMVLGSQFVEKRAGGSATVLLAKGPWGDDLDEERPLYTIHDPLKLDAAAFRSIYNG